MSIATVSIATVSIATVSIATVRIAMVRIAILIIGIVSMELMPTSLAIGTGAAGGEARCFPPVWGWGVKGRFGARVWVRVRVRG